MRQLLLRNELAHILDVQSPSSIKTFVECWVQARFGKIRRSVTCSCVHAHAEILAPTASVTSLNVWSSFFVMALKRARIRAREELDGDQEVPPPPLQIEPEVMAMRLERAKQYRRWLLGRYGAGKWHASDICMTAWYNSQTGGVGLEDMALNPRSIKRSEEHLKMVTSEIGDIPDLIEIEVWALARSSSPHGCCRAQSYI